MRAYVKIPYEDADGKHDVGDEVEFPRNTDEEKLAFDTLLRYGIITKSKSDLDTDADEDGPDRKDPEAMAAQVLRSGEGSTAPRRGSRSTK